VPVTEHAQDGYDVFVSYAEADRAWVQGYLLDALTRAGVRCHSEAAFALGVPRLEEFERAIRQSRRTVLVLSAAASADGLARFTDLLAQSYGAETGTWPVIPLLRTPLRLPPRLAMLTRLEATDQDRWNATLERLCAELQRPVPGPAPRPPCPYPGMVPFSARDARFFHGRDAEIEQMLRHLRNHLRFLLVIGPSGSGKSSLVSAGLLPKLSASSYFPEDFWLVREMRPGGQPLQTLAETLGGDPARPAQALAGLPAALPPAQRLLLVVDQFEELFAQAGRAEQHGFIAALKALRTVESCALLLALRADFYPDLMNSDLWPVDPSQRLEISPLRGEALRQAIKRPAEEVGVYLEAGLLERLLSDAADEPGVLPLLQETMVLLWDRMERRLLPYRAYEQLGSDGRSGLAVAMAAKADAALAALPDAQQKIARRIFLRLVQFGEGRSDIRRQQRVSELRAVADDPLLFEQALGHLVANRLLTLGGEAGDQGRKADIAHEMLIIGWPRSREWVQSRREAESGRRRLEAKAEEWTRLGRRSGGLLDAAELPEAERWLAGPDAADLGYDETLPALVQASRAAQTEEAARRRRAVRFRLGAVAVIGLLISTVMGVSWWGASLDAASKKSLAEKERQAAKAAADYAIGQEKLKQAAEREAAIAHSRELAASAIAQLPIDPERSVLLATEAARISRTAQAEDALRQSLVESHVRAVLRGHTGAVRGVASSPNGKFVVTASSDTTARVWEAATGRGVAVLRGHTAALTGAAFSPNGKFVVTGSADKTARVWEAATGKNVAELRGHKGWVTCVAFSPNGQFVVTASGNFVLRGAARLVVGDNTARVWEARTGKAVAELRGHAPGKAPVNNGVNGAAFSPDGRLVVTASDDNTARVWEAATGRGLAVLRGHTGGVNGAAFRPDGRLAVTASGDKTARVWQAATGRMTAVLAGHTAALTSAAFSPDGKYMVTASWDGTARVWDMSTGNTMTELRGHRNGIWNAAFSRDGRYVVTAGDDTTARVWQASTGECLAELRGHTDKVRTAAFSTDGKYVTTGSEDGTARVWDTGTGLGVAELGGHTDKVSSAAFSPDGRLVVTASWGGTARVWAARTGKSVAELRGHTDKVSSAAFGPDGRLVVTASWDGTARVWAARTGKSVAELRGHTDKVFVAAFSPDSRRLVTAGWDKVARVWEADTGRCLVELRGHTGVVSSAAFSADGKYIVTAGWDKARVWEATMGNVVAQQRDTASVRGAAFSPDGKLVVMLSGRGFGEGGVRVWESGTGRAVATLPAYASAFNSAAFSPDSKSIVTGSNDGRVQVWEASTGRCLAELRGHTTAVNGAAFSPDGKWIITASYDKTARVWEASTGRNVAVPRGHTQGVVSAAFSPDGKFVVTASVDYTARIYSCEVCGSLDDLLVLAGTRVTRELTPVEREKYLHKPGGQ
jgi:WD40 repeat protein